MSACQERCRTQPLPLCMFHAGQNPPAAAAVTKLSSSHLKSTWQYLLAEAEKNHGRILKRNEEGRTVRGVAAEKKKEKRIPTCLPAYACLLFRIFEQGLCMPNSSTDLQVTWSPTSELHLGCNKRRSVAGRSRAKPRILIRYTKVDVLYSTVHRTSDVQIS
jgi:hypothetical protein